MASSVDTVTASSSSSSSLSPELQGAIEESKIAVAVLSRNYATSAWCLAELVKIIVCKNKKNLKGLLIFHHEDPSDVGNQTGASADAFAEHEERFPDSIEEAASIPGRGLNYGVLESQIAEIVASIRNRLRQDGSTNWNLTPNESDDADEMVQDYVADLPLEAHVVPDDVADAPQEAHVVEDHAANLPQGNQNVLLDSSINWDLPPRYDATPDESDDADEMVQDYVADLPLMIEQLKGSSISLELPPRYDDYIDDAVDVMQEAHVVPDDVADAPQEAHVVPDDVANVPREAHVVEDHVANSQRLCPICDNAIGVAFCCGHQFCVECGDRYSTCPVCRDRVHIRFRVF